MCLYVGNKFFLGKELSSNKVPLIARNLIILIYCLFEFPQAGIEIVKRLFRRSDNVLSLKEMSHK